MSGYYAANPHYAADDSSEATARVEACEAEAMALYRSVTKDALALHTRTIVELMPYTGSPRWARGRDAAERKYQLISRPAWALYPRIVAELLADGEISSDLDEQLTMIRDAARAQAMEAA